MKIKPEQLHKWYLEAIKDLDSDSFNPNANKSYNEFTIIKPFSKIIKKTF